MELYRIPAKYVTRHRRKVLESLVEEASIKSRYRSLIVASGFCCSTSSQSQAFLLLAKVRYLCSMNIRPDFLMGSLIFGDDGRDVEFAEYCCCDGGEDCGCVGCNRCGRYRIAELAL